MSESSSLYRNEVIIDDEPQALALANPDGFSRGYDPGGRPEGYGYTGYAAKMDSSLLIPRNEWQARIQEAETQKARISDILTAKNVPHKDQDRTNYCWANGPTHAAETLRVIQGLPYVSLSPASVAAPMTGFKNIGGWGLAAVKYAISNGFVPSENWPDNAIDRRYQTETNRQTALSFRIREWRECKPRNLDEMVSLLLRGYPAALGFNWWGHLVMGAEAVWLDGEIAIRIRNSWKGWGANGFGILRGSKMLADDCVFPVSVRASSPGVGSSIFRQAG